MSSASGNVYSFTKKGKFDSSFGENGTLELNNGTRNSIEVQSDNKLLVESSLWLNYYKYFLARYKKPNEIGPNNIMKKDFSIENAIKIYPNPAVNIINISGLKNATGILIFTNAFGRIWKNIKINNLNTATANITDLPDGIYYIQLKLQ